MFEPTSRPSARRRVRSVWSFLDYLQLRGWAVNAEAPVLAPSLGYELSGVGIERANRPDSCLSIA